MHRRVLFALIALSVGPSLYAQSGPVAARGWTDKNNTEESAAYMIRIAYYDQGYMDVNVKVRYQGAKPIFEVDPGPIYHLKEVSVLGSGLSEESRTDIPKAGDVYSAGRMNEWIASAQSSGRFVTWGAHFDHRHAEVTITVRVQGHGVSTPSE